MHGLCPRSFSSMGLELETGRRASSTSMTISIFGITSAICLLAFAICPGNHSIAINQYPVEKKAHPYDNLAKAFTTQRNRSFEINTTCGKPSYDISDMAGFASFLSYAFLLHNSCRSEFQSWLFPRSCTREIFQTVLPAPSGFPLYLSGCGKKRSAHRPQDDGVQWPFSPPLSPCRHSPSGHAGHTHRACPPARVRNHRPKQAPLWLFSALHRRSSYLLQGDLQYVKPAFHKGQSLHVHSCFHSGRS